MYPWGFGVKSMLSRRCSVEGDRISTTDFVKEAFGMK